MIDLCAARREFDRYLDLFCREDGERMGLESEDLELAQLIALLHDIGRFEQVRRFDSFEPGVMDHAAYGAELLFGEQKMIRKFVKEDTWDELICQAIVRHSDYELGDSMDPRALLHARLIRDADKLDNCRVKLEDQMEVLLGCSKEEAGCQEISPETWRECENRKSIHSANRRTRMDYWVSYVAYFFDINFPATCRIILEKQYVERIIRRIPYGNKETEQKMKKLGEMVTEWLEEKAEG